MLINIHNFLKKNVFAYDQSGAQGDGGKAGFKNCAHAGDTKSFEWTEFINHGSFSFSMRLIKTELAEVYCSVDGKFNSSNLGRESPEVLRFHPISSIVRYKLYLIENHDKANISPMENILYTKEIDSKYGLFDLIDEYIGLEGLFFKTNLSPTKFARYFDLLGKRILYFADIHSAQLSTDHKRALSYIYTTVQSKYCALTQSNTNLRIVSKIGKWFESLKDDINKMHSIDNQRAINTNRDNYKKVLDNKINEAIKTVNTVIAPEINEQFKSMHEQLLDLIDEVIDLAKNAEKEKERLNKKRSKLEFNMKLHKLLSIIEFTSQGLAVLGPVGAGVGQIIGTSASILDSLNNGDADASNKIADDVQQMSQSFADTLDSLKGMIKTKKEATLAYINENIIVIDNFIVDHPDQADVLNLIKDELNTYKIQITALKTEELNAEACKKLINLVSFMQTVMEAHSSRFNIENIKTFFVYAGKVYNIISKAQEFFAGLSSYEQIDEIDRSLNKLSEQYESFKQLEENIYDSLLPAMNNIEDTIRSMEKQIENESHVQLDISKWTVKKVLAQIKETIGGITKDNKFERYQMSLQDIFDNVENGMNIMIDIYDRIDSYKDSAELASYIANVGSSKPKFNDPALNNKLNDFELTLHTNLVLQEYSIGLSSFNQYYFPFAPIVLGNYSLPSNLTMNDTESVIQSTARNIDSISKAILRKKISFDYFDQFIDRDMDALFYTWPHNNASRDKIIGLLTGKKVILNANIVGGRKDSAVQFKDLKLIFNLNNTSLQKELDNVLDKFLISFKMIGNCYYRCNNRFFYISMGDILFLKTSFRRDFSGIPRFRNEIADQILNNEPFISPYSNWEIQIEPQDDSSSFNDLTKFLDEPIDLKLMGNSKYIDKSLDMPQFCDHQHDMKPINFE